MFHIQYRFTVQSENQQATSKDYSFNVLSEETLGAPISLLKGDSCAYAVFERIRLPLTGRAPFASTYLAATLR